MILSEWLKTHTGEVARIGTKDGAGFIFAGVVDSFTLNRIYRYIHAQTHARKVLEVLPSAFVGYIVLIEGSEYGSAECPQYDKAPNNDDVPIEGYKRLADEIAKTCALDYEHALIKWYTAIRERDRSAADSDIYICERFFRSPVFAQLLPHVNGEDVMKLIDEKVKKMIRGEDNDE